MSEEKNSFNNRKITKIYEKLSNDDLYEIFNAARFNFYLFIKTFVKKETDLIVKFLRTLPPPQTERRYTSFGETRVFQTNNLDSNLPHLRDTLNVFYNHHIEKFNEFVEYFVAYKLCNLNIKIEVDGDMTTLLTSFVNYIREWKKIYEIPIMLDEKFYSTFHYIRQINRIEEYELYYENGAEINSLLENIDNVLNQYQLEDVDFN